MKEHSRQKEEEEEEHLRSNKKQYRKMGQGGARCMKPQSWHEPAVCCVGDPGSLDSLPVRRGFSNGS